MSGSTVESAMLLVAMFVAGANNVWLACYWDLAADNM